MYAFNKVYQHYYTAIGSQSFGRRNHLFFCLYFICIFVCIFLFMYEKKYMFASLFSNTCLINIQTQFGQQLYIMIH